MRRLTNGKFSIIIIGSGPSGLAAAVHLSKNGMNDFLSIERESETGGILNQCIHNGFGLEFFKEDLTGPQFARKLESSLPDDANVLTEAMVSSVSRTRSGGFIIRVHSREHGLMRLSADAVICTTGCRERTRENIEIPGTRPAGVFTAGQAQTLINRKHYSIGRNVVIQGSGDIGLIMARRLSIEGFNVCAVLERLPHLSGSIRNKVQCLDHFGIPLYLGRQISRIRGRNRVTGVDTAATGSLCELLPDSNIGFDCDTILFAAGLIPELESIKTAGVNLSDNFHPNINSAFETDVRGLFVAGNCLHINDLADSAAKEGISAATSALEYLYNRKLFRASITQESPYKEKMPNRELDSEYFKKIEDKNLTVCIVCPKGCLLSENHFGCKRGEEYYRRTAGPAGEFSQRVSTTVEYGGKIIPAVSAEEVPVKLIAETIGKLKDYPQITGVQKISADGQTFSFSFCGTGKKL